MKKYFAAAFLAVFVVWMPMSVAKADDASSAVLKKLNEVTQSQEKILQSLEEVKNELQTVKARVTSR